MNTQRVIKFAVGLWVMLFAITFLLSIFVEIIRDRKTKRGYRHGLRSAKNAKVCSSGPRICEVSHDSSLVTLN